jgi:hypothetical protein
MKLEVTEKYGPTAYVHSLDVLGPKAYCSVVRCSASGRVLAADVKAKGVKLCRAAQKLLTPSSMRQLLADPGSVLSLPQHIIRRDVFAQKLYSYSLKKMVRFTSAKRVVLAGSPGLQTVPFGYRGPLLLPAHRRGHSAAADKDPCGRQGDQGSDRDTSRQPHAADEGRDKRLRRQ